jgi:hypothetical protein
MKEWTVFLANHLNPAAMRPKRFFDFYVIAGDHRRAASMRLLQRGFPTKNIPPGQPQFATNLSDCMFQLKGEQAKLVGMLDNQRKVVREADAIDCVSIAQSVVRKITVKYMMDNPGRFPSVIAKLKTLKKADVLKLQGFEKTVFDTSLESPVLSAIANARMYDWRTGIFPPLIGTINFLDVREIVYSIVLEEVDHITLIDVDLNARGKRSWRYSVLMGAIHGDPVVELLYKIDEMLKANVITFSTTEPDR